MIAEVNQRDKTSWANVSRVMGLELEAMIQNAPIGFVAQQRLREATPLITTLPIKAAQRVRDLTMKAYSEGGRAKDIFAEIMRGGQVSQAEANTIARTETSRTAAVFAQTRAEHIGSTGYTWVTMRDADVRPDHRLLDGQVFSWSDPPIADRRTGARSHPGAIYNCRCIAIPVLPVAV